MDALNTKMGNLPPEKMLLKPAKVRILSVKIEDVPTKTGKTAQKVVFMVKHPDRSETVNLSSVSYLVGREVRVSGTWVNLDSDGNIQQGSALWALVSGKLGKETIAQTVNTEIDTELDGNYLCLKAY